MEGDRTLPAGGDERVSGYGVLALPFASGDLLAFRRVTASSIGPPFAEVWHRDPEGRWTFFVDAEPGRTSPRWFGEAACSVVVTEVAVRWRRAREVAVSVPSRRLEWGVRLRSTTTTGLSGRIARRGLELPGRRAPALAAGVVGRLLGAGRMPSVGVTPNGQAFRFVPSALWSVEGSAAIVEGRELGPVGPLERQARLGDFWLPNAGLFALGTSRFEPFDPSRHRNGTPAGGIVRCGRPLAGELSEPRGARVPA